MSGVVRSVLSILQRANTWVLAQTFSVAAVFTLGLSSKGVTLPDIKRVTIIDSAGTPTIGEATDVSSITDLGVGNYRVNFTTSFANANYTVGISQLWFATGSGEQHDGFQGKTAAKVEIVMRNQTGTNYDNNVDVNCLGTQ